MRGGGRGLGGNTKKVERGIIVFPPLIAPTFCRSFIGLKGDSSRLLAFTLQWKREVLPRSDILITSTYLEWEPRRYPTENLEASGTAGKLRLSKLYCSERREPSGRFSMGIAEAIQHQAFAVRQ